MNNKITIGIVALLVVSVFAFAGLTYAYRGDPTTQGPNYDADVHEQLETALEARDYDAWLQIRKDNNLPMTGKMFQVVNADNFDKYAQMHEANLVGDYETANAIRTELGLGQGMMKRGSGKGQGVSTDVKSGQCIGMQNQGVSSTHNCGGCTLHK